MALFPGLPRWAGTRKVKPIWILLKQEIVSGSGISWAICKFACRSRQITTPAPHHSSFFTDRMPFLPPNQQRQRTEGTTIIIAYNNNSHDNVYGAVIMTKALELPRITRFIWLLYTERRVAANPQTKPIDLGCLPKTGQSYRPHPPLPLLLLLSP